MARESKDEKIKRAASIVAKLKTLYPDAKCSLDYENPLQLLIATILSAQCTDVRVNKTTPALFAKYKTTQNFATAEIADLEEMIRSTGFYRNKAKSIKACCQSLLKEHGGRVPQTMEELSKLKGVGRKTANVVLGNAFDTPGMVVDTHVTRLSNRMGLAKGTDAVKIENQLMEIIKKTDWTIFSHLLIAHGRAICVARKPRCAECGIARICPKII